MITELVVFGSGALALGLIASYLLDSRPERAHLMLVLALVASVSIPVLREVVRHGGWGLMLTASTEVATQATTDAVSAGQLKTDQLGIDRSTIGRANDTPGPARAAPALAAPRHAPAAEKQAAPPSFWRRTWATIAGGLPLAWLVLSVLCALRLLRGWLGGRRLIASARPVHDVHTLQLVEAETNRQPVSRPVRCLLSEQVHSPVVWSWSRPPSLVLPARAIRSVHEGARADSDIDGKASSVPDSESGGWASVIAHELAHVHRRDHASSLLAELILALQPWNPLAWWARRRLAMLAEEACDDWAVWRRDDRAAFAHRLLSFSPAHDMLLSTASVSRGGCLKRRITRILARQRTDPRHRPAWTAAILIGSGFAVACAALGQQAPASNARYEPIAGPAAVVTTHELTGRVLDPSGQPVAGAEVLAIEGWEQDGSQLTQRTDGQGVFRFDALAGGYWFVSVDEVPFAREWDHERGVQLPIDTRKLPIAVGLQAATSLAGTVVAANGSPRAGVTVTLVREYLGPEEDMVQGHLSNDLAVTTTDADGRFVLERLREGTVVLMLDDAEHARTITKHLPTGQDDVVLQLHPGLVLRGRVLVDGVPQSGVAVDAGAFNLSHRSLGKWRVLTDADGGFEILTAPNRFNILPASSTGPTLTLRIADEDALRSDSLSVHQIDDSTYPFIEVEAWPADADRESARVEVGAPDAARLAELGGDPTGPGAIRVRLDGSPRFGDRFRHLYLTAALENGQEIYRDAAFDESGELVFGDLPPATYSLTVAPNGHPVFVVEPVELGDDPIEVLLQPGPVTLGGTITSGGAIVAGGTLSAHPLERDLHISNTHALISDEGRYTFEGLPPGRYWLHYERPYPSFDGTTLSMPNEFEIEVARAEERFDIALPASQLVGLIVDHVPTPPNDSPFQFRTPDRVAICSVGVSVSSGNLCGYAPIAEDGSFAIEHLPAGTYNLRVQSSGPSLTGHVTIPTASSEVSVTLAPPTEHGGIRGMVRGAPISEYTHVAAHPLVDGHYDLGAYVGTGEIDEEAGTYTRRELPVGIYLVHISEHRGTMPNLWFAGIEVRDGHDRVLDIDVPPSREISLRVRRGGVAPDDLHWWLGKPGGPYLNPVTFLGSGTLGNRASERSFSVAVGEYELKIECDGGALIEPFTVVEGDDVQEVIIEVR